MLVTSPSILIMLLLFVCLQLKAKLQKDDFVRFTTLLREFRGTSPANPEQAMTTMLQGFDALFRPYDVQCLHGFRQVLPAVRRLLLLLQSYFFFGPFVLIFFSAIPFLHDGRTSARCLMRL